MSFRLCHVRGSLALLVLVFAVPLRGEATQHELVDCQELSLPDRAAALGVDFVHRREVEARRPFPEIMAPGLAWIDYDRDGWVDLYVLQSGEFPRKRLPGSGNRLYRNVAGTFVDVTETSRAGGPATYGQGVLGADFDGDAWPDLFLSNYGQDAFLRNRGDGTFELVEAPANTDWSTSSAAADVDGDGDLDLYVGGYVHYEHGEVFCGDSSSGRPDYCDPSLFDAAPDRLWVNHGDMEFRDETAERGLDVAPGRALAVSLVDLDGDRRPEIYVANDLTPNLLFQNLGGRFADQSLLSGLAVNGQGKVEAGMGIAHGDTDLDGDPEIMVTNYDVETNTLYENQGGLLFRDVSAVSGAGLPSMNLLGFGIVLDDFDADGLLDVYVANGHVMEGQRRDNLGFEQRDQLLLGRPDGRFVEAACAWLVDGAGVGRGVASADFDHDGRVDLAVANNGGSLQIRHNRSAAGHWLALDLESAEGTRVGSRVVVHLDDGRRLTRWVVAGGSYLSSSDGRVHFGLGSARPERIVVDWPSGSRQVLQTTLRDITLRVREPRSK